VVGLAGFPKDVTVVTLGGELMSSPRALGRGVGDGDLLWGVIYRFLNGVLDSGVAHGNQAKAQQG